MMASFAFTLLLIIWWAFFSRARWREVSRPWRLMALALAGTWLLRHESMWLGWLFAYVIPFLSLAFVTWAVVTRRIPDRVRHATMVATILIACGAWLFVRQDGINGDHQATFGWRWAASPEERLAETFKRDRNARSSRAGSFHRTSRCRAGRVTNSFGNTRSFQSFRTSGAKQPSGVARLSWTKTRRHRARCDDQD